MLDCGRAGPVDILSFPRSRRLHNLTHPEVNKANELASVDNDQSPLLLISVGGFSRKNSCFALFSIDFDRKNGRVASRNILSLFHFFR